MATRRLLVARDEWTVFLAWSLVLKIMLWKLLLGEFLNNHSIVSVIVMLQDFFFIRKLHRPLSQAFRAFTGNASSG
ncbi:hypothetical protein V8E54_014788 [Elaphomyces granulatus]|jgi:hypothetical protein